MTYRYFEDFHPGETLALGNRGISEAEITAFARDYDPQSFHIDAEAARHSAFGGLVASGWHSCAIFMRLLVDGLLKESSALASPGVDEIRWLKPVRPGDALSVRITFTGTRRSKSRPDRGFAGADIEILNQDDEVVMTLKTTLYLLAREPAA